MRSACKTIAQFKRLSLDEKAADVALGASDLAARHPEMVSSILASIEDIQPTPRLLEMTERIRAIVKLGDPS